MSKEDIIPIGDGLIEGQIFEGNDPDINWVEGESGGARMISMTRPYKQSAATIAAIKAYQEVNPEQSVVKPSTPMKELARKEPIDI